MNPSQHNLESDGSSPEGAAAAEALLPRAGDSSDGRDARTRDQRRRNPRRRPRTRHARPSSGNSRRDHRPLFLSGGQGADSSSDRGGSSQRRNKGRRDAGRSRSPICRFRPCAAPAPSASQEVHRNARHASALCNTIRHQPPTPPASTICTIASDCECSKSGQITPRPLDDTSGLSDAVSDPLQRTDNAHKGRKLKTGGSGTSNESENNFMRRKSNTQGGINEEHRLDKSAENYVRVEPLYENSIKKTAVNRNRILKNKNCIRKNQGNINDDSRIKTRRSIQKPASVEIVKEWKRITRSEGGAKSFVTGIISKSLTALAGSNKNANIVRNANSFIGQKKSQGIIRIRSGKSVRAQDGSRRTDESDDNESETEVERLIKNGYCEGGSDDITVGYSHNIQRKPSSTKCLHSCKSRQNFCHADQYLSLQTSLQEQNLELSGSGEERDNKDPSQEYSSSNDSQGETSHQQNVSGETNEGNKTPGEIQTVDGGNSKEGDRGSLHDSGEVREDCCPKTAKRRNRCLARKRVYCEHIKKKLKPHSKVVYTPREGDSEDLDDEEEDPEVEAARQTAAKAVETNNVIGYEQVEYFDEDGNEVTVINGKRYCAVCGRSLPPKKQRLIWQPQFRREVRETPRLYAEPIKAHKRNWKFLESQVFVGSKTLRLLMGKGFCVNGPKCRKCLFRDIPGLRRVTVNPFINFFIVYLRNAQGANQKRASAPKAASEAGKIWNCMSPSERRPFVKLAHLAQRELAKRAATHCDSCRRRLARTPSGDRRPGRKRRRRRGRRSILKRSASASRGRRRPFHLRLSPRKLRRCARLDSSESRPSSPSSRTPSRSPSRTRPRVRRRQTPSPHLDEERRPRGPKRRRSEAAPRTGAKRRWLSTTPKGEDPPEGATKRKRRK